MAVQLLDDEKTREVKDSSLGIPDGDPETIYVLRDLTKKIYRDVTKRHTEKVHNRRTHQKDDLVDYAAVSDDLLDYALVDWRGVTSRGEKVPCTREYKMLLDAARSAAILDAAGMGTVQEAPEVKKESFRQPASVV